LKVFITGGTGILGRQLISRLFDKDFEVVALEKGKELNRRRLVPFSEKITWIDGDVGDLMALQSGMEDADFVIHAAALVSFNPADRTILHKINVEGTSNIVNCALVAPKLKKLVYVSSVASLSPSKPAPSELNERNGFNPEDDTSDYAYTKYQAELEIARGVEEGLKAAMVNPSIILSQGSTKESSNTLFGYAQKGMPFYPTGWINYVDVRDVCEVIVKLLTEGPENGERLVLSAGHISYKEFLEKSAQTLKVQAPKIETSPFLSEIAWRLNFLICFIFRKKPFLTKFTARASAKRLIYRSDLLAKIWPDFRFKKLDDSIHWVCSNLK
jgi:dihydroflavonol-4-reductase